MSYCPQCGVAIPSSQHHCPPSEGSLENPEALELQKHIKGTARVGYEDGQFFIYYRGYYHVHEDDGTRDSNREVWRSALKRYIGTSTEEALRFIEDYRC